MVVTLLDFKYYLAKVLSLFFILGIVFIPLTFYGLGYQYLVTNFIFTSPVSFVQIHYFTGAIKHIDFSSDTVALNLLICFLLVVAVLSVALMYLFRIDSSKLIIIIRSLSPYYVAGILLKYGIDKLLKQQFYLPEPNILYTSFGALTKDILFWSTMGTSYVYSVITGSIEILTAILILVRRTQTLGFFLSIAVIVTILIINFSFDISVKTFSLFLLSIVIFNIYPSLSAVYAFLIKHQQAQLPAYQRQESQASKMIQLGLSIALIGCVLYPYILAGDFNDDLAERPLLHGAYEITRFIIGVDTLKESDFPYKRLFIHRNGYIIFQGRDDHMTDYFFDMNVTRNQLTLQDYNRNKILINYYFNTKASMLKLTFSNKQRWVIESKSLNWKDLPALRDKIHYTIDEIK